MHPHPPRWLRAIISACVPMEDNETLLSELDEMFIQRAADQGAWRARAWYVRQAAGFVMRLGSLSALGSLDSFPGDIRTSVRYLRRHIGYSSSFMLTLGLGTGVLCTAYTAANWVLLRPVPGVHEADSLVTLRLGSKNAPAYVSFPVSQPDLQSLRAGMPMLSEIAASAPVNVDVQLGDGQPDRLSGELVSANYFHALRTRIVSGRGFYSDDDSPASGRSIVVVSGDLAKRWSRQPASLVGANLRINGTRFEIVGITEAGFRGAEIPGKAMMWFPLSTLQVVDPSTDGNAASDRAHGVWSTMIGRLARAASPEVTVASANRVMNVVRDEFRGQPHSFMATHFAFQVFDGVGLNPGVRGVVRHTLGLVAIAGGLLMLLVIANLSNLTLAQAIARESTLAVRLALGAGRVRIARSILVETVFLGLGGATVGLLLATLWGHWFAGASLAQRGGSLSGMHMEARVVAATVLLALIAAVVASMRQILAVRPGAFEHLIRTASTRVSRRSGLQMSLVVVQVALSFTLAVTAGLLNRTIGHLRKIELGFTPGRLVTFAIEPHLHGFERQRLEGLQRQIEQQLAQQPGVTAAGFISPSPLETGYLTSVLYPSTEAGTQPVVGAGFFVTPGFFDALGARVIAGEKHWNGDSASIVITMTALRKLHPEWSPDAAIGRLVPAGEKGTRLRRIAAVIDDVRLSNITDEIVPVIFRPMRERYNGMSVTGMVRSAGPTKSAVAATRKVMTTLAPDIPLFAMQDAQTLIDQQFAERKVMALAASTLGGLGLILSAIGLFGVLAHLVTARRREIGIRIALGATSPHILRQILWNGMAPTVAGLLIGLAGAVFMSALLKSQLYGITPHDPLTYIRVMVILLAVAVITCLLPAVRAARVVPTTAMRAD